MVDTVQAPAPTRRVLVLTHTGRAEAAHAAHEVVGKLRAAGLQPMMLRDDYDAILESIPESLNPESVWIAATTEDFATCEVGMVLGGDGSILRAADLVREAQLPLMGINLGHVGFLAESERTQIDDSVRWVATRSYTVEERMALDIQIWSGKEHLGSNWALNEASIEKASRQRMIELVIEIDGAPVSSFGCDGVVMSTPTGSTAYAFSAGGPIVWPGVQALVMVPISAHALFARPLVVAPDSMMAVELLGRTQETGILWCDGQRPMKLPTGSRVEVTRSPAPVRLARVLDTPFSRRLVEKFSLPTTGWRGPVEPVHSSTGPVHSSAEPVHSPVEPVHSDNREVRS